jgi:hypothetical protein
MIGVGLSPLSTSFRGHGEGDVVHRAVGRDDVASAGQMRRGGDSRRAFGCVGKPEERERIAVADVEEEVLAHVVGQLDRFDEGHAHDVTVERDRFVHVAADEREMMDARDPELLVLAIHASSPAVRCASRRPRAASS